MTKDILQEIWLPIAGYEGAYEVSNFGNVRSLDRKIETSNRWGQTIARLSKGRILKTSPDKDGYTTVGLFVNGKGSTQRIHKLVAQAFLGDRPKNFDINHIDGNKANNHISNLEYCTKSQNSKHAFKIGLRQTLKGSKSKTAKLIEADIPKIRERLNAGDSQKEIAKDYGVNNRTISAIKIGKIWAHII